jgi:hypothetical protein
MRNTTPQELKTQIDKNPDINSSLGRNRVLAFERIKTKWGSSFIVVFQSFKVKILLLGVLV